ncbi:MAG TPA: metallopeptidase TldD-related protein [Burkholderiales bacterium]|nr:metallopeptidase TldD-related protein [Burkholderiales bacterium]
MKDAFFGLSETLGRNLGKDEILLCNFAGERSDFVRFNQGKVRQAGSVEQRVVSLRLVRARRQASASISIAGTKEDAEVLNRALADLREALAELPEDPWLLINETPQSSSSERRGTIAAAEEVVRQVVSAARGRDLVGFYAGGTLYRGFANSLGQHNWHEVDSFNFDCSLYLEEDKAVKTGYAGFEWEEAVLAQKLGAAASELELLGLPRRTIEPGEYRAYLSPRALDELTGLLCWGGFSARARATKQSPLLRMQQGETLSSQLTVRENTGDGIAPGFQGDGFVKPSSVTLISAGELGDALISPRSAKEYDLATNAANGRESPESLELAPGRLAQDELLQALDRGLYISNLWYLNYSDRPAGRITGMTRFATFWIEGGRIVAPLTPMRFDDSIYRLLGDNLLDLTRERDLLLDSSTYGERSTSSARLPGALLRSLKLTL